MPCTKGNPTWGLASVENERRARRFVDAVHATRTRDLELRAIE